MESDLGTGSRLVSSRGSAVLFGACHGVQLSDVLPQCVLCALDVCSRLLLRDAAFCLRVCDELVRLTGVVRLGDLGVSQYLSDTGATDGVQVGRVVADALDFQGVDLQTDLVEVFFDLVAQRLNEAQSVSPRR